MLPAWGKSAVSLLFRAVQRVACFACANLYVAVDVAVAVEIAQRFQNRVNDGGDDGLFETLQADKRIRQLRERLAWRSTAADAPADSQTS